MTNQNHSGENRNALILERLRAAFGEDRQGEFGDLDGMGTLATFLRPLDSEGDAEASRGALTKPDLMELRRQRRLQLHAAPEKEDTDDVPVGAAPSGAYAGLLEEMPRLREHFAEWLASVDSEYTPSSSSLDELRALRGRVEYRLRLLSTAAGEAQRELDDLVVAIRAAESVHPD